MDLATNLTVPAEQLPILPTDTHVIHTSQQQSDEGKCFVSPAMRTRYCVDPQRDKFSGNLTFEQEPSPLRE